MLQRLPYISGLVRDPYNLLIMHFKHYVKIYYVSLKSSNLNIIISFQKPLTASKGQWVLYSLKEHYISIGTCRDLSNIIYPAEDGKCQGTSMKPCKDNKTCIHENLFCDGHEQCKDGSDEEQAFCQLCPR